MGCKEFWLFLFVVVVIVAQTFSVLAMSIFHAQVSKVDCLVNEPLHIFPDDVSYKSPTDYDIIEIS